MFFDRKVVFTAYGKLDFENERDVAINWMKSCGLNPSFYEFGYSKGFYIVSNNKKQKKVFLCCTQDLSKTMDAKFWFGFSESHISGNADTAVIFILVWENHKREYLVFNNSDVLTWRHLWYLKEGKYSIDVDKKGGSYIMRGKDGYKCEVGGKINDILHLFEKV